MLQKLAAEAGIGPNNSRRTHRSFALDLAPVAANGRCRTADQPLTTDEEATIAPGLRQPGPLQERQGAAASAKKYKGAYIHDCTTLAPLGRPPFSHGTGSLAAVAARAQQLQVAGLIGATLRLGQDVIYLHHPEREVSMAAGTDVLLFPVEAVAAGAVVREFPKVCPSDGALGKVGCHHQPPIKPA